MILTLTGSPKSTNSLYKSHCKFGHPVIYMTNEGKALKESYQWQAKSQWKGKPTDRTVSIHIMLFFNTQRKHDIDNYGKILLDSLTKIVWNDDNQIIQQTVIKMFDKQNPRIELSVTELN